MRVLAVIAATLALVALALRLAVRVIVRLPADYLNGARPPPVIEFRGRAQRFARPLERVLGVVLVVVGALASLPGVPGPGLAIALIGLMLADIPGTHRLARKLLRKKPVRAAVDRVRARFGCPPLK